MRAPFFFYGTLMDGDVLGAVVGRRIAAGACRPAVIRGFRRVRRAGTSYPILVAAPGGRVAGVLVAGLGARDVVRLVVFEGDDYGLAAVTVEPRHGAPTAAQTFLPRPGVPAAGAEWCPDAWRRRHKPRYLLRLRGFGCRQPD